MKRICFPLLALALTLAAAACRPAAAPDTPPEIHYGEDVCDKCSMIISDPRFAAAYYTEDGEARRFDDIGGMCKFHLEHPDEVAARMWVHDYATTEWLDAKSAVYVMSENLHSPMGHGLAAVATPAQAEKLAAETSGMIMTFDELLAYYETNGTAMPR